MKTPQVAKPGPPPSSWTNTPGSLRLPVGRAGHDGDNTHLVLGAELGYPASVIADIDTLFAEALALPDDSRLQLVERLISTIQSEPSLEAEQVQEVQRRMEDVRSGRVKTIPGELVFREIEQSLAARRLA